MGWIALAIVTAAIVFIIGHKNQQASAHQNPASTPSPSADSDWSKMSFFEERVVGVTRKNDDGTSRQDIIGSLREGEKINLARNPSNRHDPNAIEVYSVRGEQVGFIERRRASELAPQMDKGYRVEPLVEKITGGGPGLSYGLVIGVQRYKPIRKSG